MITERAVNRLANAYRTGGARALAYLEHAQEHFLKWMDEEALFTEAFGTAFKGGTAIRKFHLGQKGRFSTDLDFAIHDHAVAKHVIDALKAGFEYEGVRFLLDGKPSEDPGETHAKWRAATPELGSTIPAKLDFSRHGVWLPYQLKERAPILTVDMETLGFEPVRTPLVDLRENLAEKLARFRRLPLARDVFDLVNLGPAVRSDLPLIRELLLLKVWSDVVYTSRGTRPFRGRDEYCGVTAAQLGDKDDLGALAKAINDWDRELKVLCDTYGAAIGKASDEREQRLAKCIVDDKWWFEKELSAFTAAHA